MKKIYFVLIFLYINVLAIAQPMGNEWIKSNQVYFKIKIIAQGVYKIDSNILTQFGIDLSNINPNKFQIFKNGIEQPCFVKGETDGVFNTNDYLLFYANINDGKLDAELYKTNADQPHQLNSLFSDTAVYFFTILPTSTLQLGKRFTSFSDTNYGAYTPESYFINELNIAPLEEYYRGGFTAVGDGEFYYYSDYINGESWLGNKFGLADSRTYSFNTPNNYNTGPSAILTTKVFGVSNDRSKAINHHLKIGTAINNNGVFNTIKDTTYSGYIETQYQILLNNAAIGNTTQINFETVPDLGLSSDFSAVSFINLKYASICNFNNQSTLYFKHTAQQTAIRMYFLFANYNKSNPQVINLTNNKKIEVSLNGSNLNFLIENNTTPQELFIYDETDIKSIIKLEQVNMNLVNTNVNTEFIIISNNQLQIAANAYKNYRSQNFETVLVYSNDLYNQFFYGYEHPLAIKHFLKYIYQNQSIKPSYLLLLGRGYQNNLIRSNFQNAYSNNLVPAIGEPSSDNLFTAGLNMNIPYTPAIATGRIPAATNEQALNYLDKLIAYEKDTFIAADWRKQILHLTGGSGAEQIEYTNQLLAAKAKIKNINFGANVTSFNKNTTQNVEIGLKSKLINELNSGKSLMTFLGHGSLSVLDVDFGGINDLQNNNKYTFFYFNGCNIGNANDADPMGSGNIYGKDFLTAANKGAIGWLAHSNFTLTGQLYSQISSFYNNLGTKMYGQSIGKIIQQAITETTQSGNAFEVSHGYQILYQGDPALKLASPPLPDYEITDNNIFLTDKNLTALADSIEINIIVKNLGKANNDSLYLSIEHEIVSSNLKFLYDSIILPSPNYSDTLTLKIKGQGKTMVGDNIFHIKIDFINAKIELNENNNEASFKKFIPGSGINLVYPLNFEVVSSDSVQLVAQNNDLFSKDKEYIFEIDNSKMFNSTSPYYQTSGIIKANDLIKWAIKLNDKDTMVYYWRAKLNVPENKGGTWVDASFTFIKNSSFGFMQSAFEQFSNASQADKIIFDSINKQMAFVNNELVLGIQNKRFDHRNMGIIIPYQLNEGVGSCSGNNVVAFVFEPFQVDIPYEIPNYPFNCPFVQNNKQNRSRRYYPFGTTTQFERDEFRRFIDSIPSGYYVAMFSRYGSEIQNWDAATLTSLSKLGITKINQIKSKNTAWAFISMKNAEPGFAMEDTINNDSLGALVDAGLVGLPPASNQPQDSKLLSINKALLTKWFKGSMVSKPLGPASSWQWLNFNFIESEVSINSKFNLDIIGVKPNGNDTVLYTNITQSNFNLSAIDAYKIPYLKLKINMEDSAKRTPQYFGFWQLVGSPVAEAKLSPSIAYSIKNNPIEEGDSLQVEIAIENISAIKYDSSNLNLSIINDARIVKYQSNISLNSLPAYGSVIVKKMLPTVGLQANNQIQLTLNNDKKVTEITHINNFISDNFIVKNDKSNPFINVVFDGIKIMNGDIVSATPTIHISSLDNNKFLLQNDTSLFTLMLRKPNSIEYERVNLQSNEIQFLPATNSSNKALLIFKPINLIDGMYSLKVQATDAVGNKAGSDEFLIDFNIVNQSSISRFFAYPNPATTNIRFVFTLTGSKLPDNLLIRISTITGKVVKEITKQEFGTIKFGNNISEYAWDGNDMYGDRLANGVYLYQVFTRINDKNITQLNSTTTDKYFTEGVGKIYLMR